MPKLTGRKQLIVAAFEALKGADRGIVEQYEGVLNDYWNEDRCRTDNIEFLLNISKKRPILNAGMRKLLPLYLPCNVKKTANGFIVTNRKNVSKRIKAKQRLEVKKLLGMRLTSILKHPHLNEDKIAEAVEFDWSKKSKSFKKQVQSLLDNDVKASDLIDIINALVERDQASGIVVSPTGEQTVISAGDVLEAIDEGHTSDDEELIALVQLPMPSEKSA